LTRELFAGLDLGGTEVKVGICGSDGQEIWSDRFPSYADQGQDAILDALGKAGKTAIDLASEHDGEVKALGLGTPGVVDPKEGKIRFPVANLGGWHGTDIIGFFQDESEQGEGRTVYWRQRWGQALVVVPSSRESC